MLPKTAPRKESADDSLAEPKTLVESAYRNLRRDIIEGRLTPGEKLRIEHIKDNYGVGAGTMREALSLLISDALVNSQGQRGFRVAPTSLEDFQDITRNRVMLECEALRQSMLLALTRFETLRVRDHAGSPADYELRSYIHKDGPKTLATMLLVHRLRHQVIWSWSGIVPRAPDTGAFDTDKVAADISFVIGQPTGVLHANERNRNHDYDTPYGCWLGFTSQLQDNFRIGSGQMAHCATAWHDAAPRNPIAAGLYSWILLDQSMLAYSEDGRQDLVEQAIDVAEAARQINPCSSFVQISAVRNFAFAHRDAELQASIRQALALNPDNLDVKGMAGMMLVLNNHPEGLPLLHEAIARHFNPPAWYFIGIYMHAMMQEDVAGARAAVERAAQRSFARGGHAPPTPMPA